MKSGTFTCDHCSAAVDLHAVRCPSCGKTFDAVRCPRCGHQGSPNAFSDGCPKCRYLAAPARPRRASRPVFPAVMGVLLVLLVAAVTVAWVLRGR